MKQFLLNVYYWCMFAMLTVLFFIILPFYLLIAVLFWKRKKWDKINYALLAGAVLVLPLLVFGLYFIFTVIIVFYLKLIIKNYPVGSQTQNAIS